MFHHAIIFQDLKETLIVRMKRSVYNYFLILYTVPSSSEELNIFSVILFMLHAIGCFDWLTFCLYLIMTFIIIYFILPYDKVHSVEHFYKKQLNPLNASVALI